MTQCCQSQKTSEALRCAPKSICAAQQSCPLNLPDFAALRNVAIGPYRHFAAAQQSVALRGITDIDQPSPIATIAYTS
jgi:hypothetical protein